MEEEIYNYLTEELGLWAVIGYFVLIFFIVPILITFFSKYIEIQFFTNLLLKKKNQSWIKIFRTDKSISQCLYEYGQLKKSSDRFQLLFIYLGLFSGIILPFLLIFILLVISQLLIENVIQRDYLSFYAFTIFNLIVPIISLKYEAKLFNRAKSVKYDQLVSKFKIINLFIFIIYFALSFVVYLLLINYSIFHVFILLQNPSELNINLILLLNTIAFILTFILILVSISDRMRFVRFIQSLFNIKWFIKFPKVCITTSGGVQISGIVKDAFNTDYIILNKNGNQVITLWSSVDSIEFYGKNK